MRMIAIVLALMAPLPASALSCRPPSVTTSFEQAQQSPDSYVVVHGRLTVDERLMPRAEGKGRSGPKRTLIPAAIMGRSLSQAGFKLPFERKITLEVACFGPWCGDIASGTDVLAFLRQEAHGYALMITPCGGDVFVTPPAKMLKQVKTCFRRGQC